MAVRYIATKMAIQGESEYRKALTRINNTQKELQSELKLTQSQFQNNANSMAALTAKGASLNKLFEAQANKVDQLKKALANAEKAEKDYADQKEILSQKIKKNSDRLKELAKSTEDTTEESEKLKAENKDLAAQLSKVEGNLDAASRGVNSWKTQLNTAEIKLSDLNAEVKLNDEYLDEAKESADKCATSIDRFGDRVKDSAEKADTLSDALGAAGVAAAIKMTADAMAAAARSSMEYESAITGVAKTTDLTEAELGELTQKIKDLSNEIPATTTVIAGVAEAAGQLGIQKDHLLDFATVMVNLGVATNLSAQEAASALAKFANVVSMSADNYERLGSTIVALGNNFATTEADIVSMATRLASTGSVVGLTEPQIMAIATALSAVGIEAEAGGSAISKLLKQFEVMVQTASPELQQFADVAGMSAAEFSDAWKNNAVGALDQFIQGLGRVDEAGGSSVAVLDKLGLTEVRLSNSVLALASSQGVLGKALNTADSAWAENSALAREAGMRYATTESKMQMLANSANNVKTSIGDKLTPALKKFADTGVSANEWLAEAVDNSGALIPVLAGTATGVTVLTGAVAGYNLAIKAGTAMTKLFSAAMTASPVGLAVAGIAALAAGVAVFAASVDSAVPSVKELSTEAGEWDKAFSEAKTSLEETQTQTMATADVAERYISRLKELEATGLQTNEQQREYHDILALLCQTIPELAQYIDLENDAIIGGTAALEANTQAWKENAIQQAYQEKTIELQKEYSDILIEQASNQIGLTRAKEKQRAAEEDLEAVQERMNELTDEAIEKAKIHRKETGETADYTAFLTQEYTELQMSIMGLASTRDDAAHEATIYQKALDEDAESIEQANLGLAEMDAVFQKLTENVGVNTEVTAENTDKQTAQADVIVTIQDELTVLAEEYKAAYEAAYDSINGQIGLFDTFSAEISEDTDTVEEMIARWAEQTENLGKYTENLEKAAKYGLDEGLVASLSDGSVQSAGYLDTIIQKIEDLGGSTEGMSTSATEFVTSFNEAFIGTNEAKENFAATVAGMETDLENTLQRMRESAEDVGWTEGLISSINNAFANVGINFRDIGINVGEGLSEGVAESSGDAARAASEMGSGIERAAKDALDIHSPSGVFQEIGHRVGEGAETGIRESTPEAVNAVEDMGNDMAESMGEAADSGVNAFGDGLSRLPDEATYQMQAMIDSVISAADGLSWEMEYIGNEIVEGMIRGMENKSYELDRTARRIVNSAMNTTARTAQVRSPSKRTTEIFENVGEGMVVGLENKRKRVAEKAQSVVNEALTLEVKVPKIDTRMPNIDFTRQSDHDRKDSRAIEKLSQTVEHLGEKVEGFANGAFVLDGDTIVGKWAPKIDRKLGASERRKARGLV